MDGQEVWVDEHGQKVLIVPFFSRLFKDRESEETDEQIFRYNWGKPERLFFSWQDFLKHNYRGGFFGKAEIESVVREILTISAMISRTVGIAKEEFHDFLASGRFLGTGGDQYFLAELIQAGFLREKLVKGVVTLFPTEKMLRRYRCRRAPEHELVRTGLRVSLSGSLTDRHGERSTLDGMAAVWAKRARASISRILHNEGYLVLQTGDSNSTHHVFLLTKERLTEVFRFEEAEWLGELFCAEVLQEEDLPKSNAFALYQEDLTWRYAPRSEIFNFRGSNRTGIRAESS